MSYGTSAYSRYRTPKPVSVEAAVELVTPAPVKKSVPYSSLQKQETATGAPAKPKQPAWLKQIQNYKKIMLNPEKENWRFVQDYELGIDIDDSIESLKRRTQSPVLALHLTKKLWTL